MPKRRKKSDRWNVPGSPLDGKKVPQDWNLLEFPAKKQALVHYGYAKSFSHAAKVMACHSGAVRHNRAERERQEREGEA